jgi:hypothetical protein
VHEERGDDIRGSEKGGKCKWTTTHPIVVKHAPLDLVQNIPRRGFKRLIHVVSRFRAGFDEQEALFAGPLGCFCGSDLALFERGGGDRGVRGSGHGRGGLRGFAEIDLVADEDTGEVWVCVFSHVGEPSARVHETCVEKGGNIVVGIAKQPTGTTKGI